MDFNGPSKPCRRSQQVPVHHLVARSLAARLDLSRAKDLGASQKRGSVRM